MRGRGAKCNTWSESGARLGTVSGQQDSFKLAVLTVGNFVQKEALCFIFLLGLFYTLGKMNHQKKEINKIETPIMLWFAII